jgi:hypothetical protein
MKLENFCLKSYLQRELQQSTFTTVELYNLVSSFNIVRVFKQKLMNEAEHVARVEEVEFQSDNQIFYKKSLIHEVSDLSPNTLKLTYQWVLTNIENTCKYHSFPLVICTKFIKLVYRTNEKS